MELKSKYIKNIQNKTSVYFRKNGYKTQINANYILENYSDWEKNIIENSVVKYIHDNEIAPLHKFIHHGLSSQACIFNLLGPLVEAKDGSALIEIIELSGIKLNGEIDFNNSCFEKSTEGLKTGGIFGEDRGQQSSIDLYLETTENAKAIIEFKFTESEFGTCSVYENGDCDGSNPKQDPNMCYLHKEKQRNYIKLMNEYELLNDVEYCPFTEFYQAYRMLIAALKLDGNFLLIHDERNPTFLKEINGVIRGRYVRFKNLLPDKYKKTVYILTIQEIIKYLEKHGSYCWLTEFKEKYI